MDNVIRYGDTVKILNNYQNWDGGYLSVYHNDTRPGAKHNVVTVTPSYSNLGGGIWRIESGTGKPIGSEIINNDTILLHNLYQCDGGYLTCYSEAGSEAPTEIYKVNTSDINLHAKTTMLWLINQQNVSQDGRITEEGIFALFNRYDKKGFLNTCNHATFANSKYQVFTSGSTPRLPYTGLWKMEKVNDPCAPNKPSNCGGECGTNDTGKYCFQLPQSIRFGLTAYDNTSTYQQTVKVYIDGLLIDTLTGKETTTKSYTSGTGKICIEIEGNGKPCKLRYSYNTLEGKPGAVIIGAENSTNNNYNDSIVILHWPLL
ncbi:fucose-binding lectin II [Photorhabdus thracensis]|uniref:fucose-binding lectin II n=1 Tax=Photorhabdus thracensis TaxID=230089 RepID=UPI001E5DD462|nr:fucose-binding lectin II [Photorhabdus thracensis]MCC8421136.1 fucose-binding lectin II [Photorhabdus thracensis]